MSGVREEEEREKHCDSLATDNERKVVSGRVLPPLSETDFSVLPTVSPTRVGLGVSPT